MQDENKAQSDASQNGRHPDGIAEDALSAASYDESSAADSTGDADSTATADGTADADGTPDAATADGAQQPEDAATEAAAPADPLELLQQELESEQARYAELLDKYQRATAEFQNSRRRLEKQMADAIDRASVRVILKLLPVLDDAELAFSNTPASLSDDQAAWVDGFRAIQKKLLTVIEEEGVTLIPLTGAFDPTRHEAVTSEPSDEVESGHIISTLRVGYEHNGAVVRPALVRVAQ
jgi:molecular chaperone GrpE